MLQYFETVESLLSSVALLEACDVTNNDRHLSRHGILPNIRHQVKTARNGDFFYA